MSIFSKTQFWSITNIYISQLTAIVAMQCVLQGMDQYKSLKMETVSIAITKWRGTIDVACTAGKYWSEMCNNCAYIGNGIAVMLVEGMEIEIQHDLVNRI